MSTPPTTGYATPGDLATQITSLDRLIRELDGVVVASKSPKVDRAFRTAFRLWTKRWELFRGEADSYTSRLLTPFELEARLAQWRDSYQRWLADVQRRVATTELRQSEPTPPPETLLPSASDLAPLIDSRRNWQSGALVGAVIALGGLAVARILAGR